MKSRIALISLVFITAGLMLAITLPQLAVHAGTAQGCYTKPCPQPQEDEKQKKVPTKTPIPPSKTPPPTDTPIPTATDTAKAQGASLIGTKPECSSAVGAGTNEPAPDSPSNANSSPLFPWLLGGGGLILGLGLGYFTGGLRGKRSVNGDGIVGPDMPSAWKDKWDKFDKWQPEVVRVVGYDPQAAKEVKADGSSEIHPAGYDTKVDGMREFSESLAAETALPAMNAGSKDNKDIKAWQKADAGLDTGTADMFHKRQDAGIQDDTVHPGGANTDMFDKRGATGIQDDTVHPGGANIDWGDRTGMGDGSVRPTDYIKQDPNLPGDAIGGEISRDK